MAITFLDVFNDIDRSFGLSTKCPNFTSIRKNLEDIASIPSNTYPPTNIIKCKDGTVKIEMAIAGFTKDDISVTFDERTLTITGKIPNSDKSEDVYISKGIASRDFTKSFRIAENGIITDVILKDGMLSIGVIEQAVENKLKSLEITVK
jgi:molecular chaperone IbpA